MPSSATTIRLATRIQKSFPDGQDQVKLFFLAGEDRVWHPASIENRRHKRSSLPRRAVSKPARRLVCQRGEIGWQPNLYNKALLPMTPFIYFDQQDGHQ